MSVESVVSVVSVVSSKSEKSSLSKSSSAAVIDDEVTGLEDLLILVDSDTLFFRELSISDTISSQGF